jgi:ribosomal protein S12 methylthiotransferase accessory factor
MRTLVGSRLFGIDNDAGHKGYLYGTHRTVAPAETLARLRPFIERMGITRVANVTGLDRIGLPVVMVSRPNSRSVAVSQGKGLDLDAAKASGVMEAAETYHAERISHPLKFASHLDLCGSHNLLDVDGLPRISESRFHQALRMLWIEGHDVVSGEDLWLPYEVVHANYTLPLPPGSGCFVAGTNGLASGNHLLEAVCHGLAEVIERDSTSIWNRLDKPARDRTRIDLDGIDDPDCRGVLDILYKAGLTVAVWETTTDIGVPSFYCMIIDDRRGKTHLGAGAGCHPARQIALLRALTEAVQVRTTYIIGARDDLSPDEYTDRGVALKARQAKALMTSSEAGRAFGDGPDHASSTFEADVTWMLDRVQAVGIAQVIVVDLTRSQIGLPVVRVVVPGLEGPDDDDSYEPGPRARAAYRATS